VPSRSAESFGLAAAEAMADGIPVVATAAGALPELVGDDAVVAPGDAAALAAAARARFGDEEAGAAGLQRIRDLASPGAVGERLRALY
jgi:glycosyltransferase involved in cell wall biosynthesis